MIDPATENEIGTIPAATAEDVNLAVKAARDAVKARNWTTSSGVYRAGFLRALSAKVSPLSSS